MRKDPYDKIIESIVNEVASEIAEFADEAPGDSPIEKIFLTALYAQLRFGSCEHDTLFIPEDEAHLKRLFDIPNCRTGLIVQPQVQLAGWRVDYLIHAYDHGFLSKKPGRWMQLIVECDGHNFHERTKRQASRDRARDREAQALDIPVYRFTGSEIWKDPYACAWSVIEWAQKGL